MLGLAINEPSRPGGPEGDRFFDGAQPRQGANQTGLPRHLQELIQAGLARRQQGYRGRFAPSPTGDLHRGNLRTALLSWLHARLQGGEWLLRLDDLDQPRNRPGAATRILADLRWLGLDWDGPPLLQSSRRGLYTSLLSSLRRRGSLGPATASQ